MSKRIKTLFIILFFMSPVLFSFIPVVSAQSEESYGENIVLDANLIRNFAFDKFNSINLSGSNEAYGGKLKFEMLPKWELEKDNVDLVSEYIVGDKLYLFYKVALTNKLNIYTNVKLSQATAKGLNKVDDELLVYQQWNRPWWAITDAGFEQPRQYITFQHYDFGDILTHNSLQNTFGGNLEMTFDIDDTPVPETLTDSEGNAHAQEFAYISLSSVGVNNIEHGDMSSSMPHVQGISVSEEQIERCAVSQADTNSKQWNAVPELGDPKLSVSFGEGLQFQSEGSNMNPTAKNGDPIWNPKEEKSMSDGRIKFNIGRISPMVYQWNTRLDYTYWNIHYTEQWFTGIWINDRANPTEKSLTKPTALHVVNRFAQVEIQAVFDIYTCFTIKVPEESPLEDYTLEKPTEYYEDLVWQSSVEGATFGYYSAPANTGLIGILGGFFGSAGGIFMTILMVIIIIAVIYITVKLVSQQRSSQPCNIRVVSPGTSG